LKSTGPANAQSEDRGNSGRGRGGGGMGSCWTKAGNGKQARPETPGGERGGAQKIQVHSRRKMKKAFKGKCKKKNKTKIEQPPTEQIG